MFKTSQGFGLDRISSIFLKVGMSVLAESLSRLYNMSTSPGLFPDGWKIARLQLSIVMAQKMIFRTIALYLSCQSSLAFLKNWFMINFMIFLL